MVKIMETLIKMDDLEENPLFLETLMLVHGHFLQATRLYSLVMITVREKNEH